MSSSRILKSSLIVGVAIETLIGSPLGSKET